MHVLEINSVLHQFCFFSDQKVNLLKSKVWFSPNVDDERAAGLSGELGIGIAKDIGKYLGVHCNIPEFSL